MEDGAAKREVDGVVVDVSVVSPETEVDGMLKVDDGAEVVAVDVSAETEESIDVPKTEVVADVTALLGWPKTGAEPVDTPKRDDVVVGMDTDVLGVGLVDPKKLGTGDADDLGDCPNTDDAEVGEPNTDAAEGGELAGVGMTNAGTVEALPKNVAAAVAAGVSDAAVSAVVSVVGSAVEATASSAAGEGFPKTVPPADPNKDPFDPAPKGLSDFLVEIPKMDGVEGDSAEPNANGLARAAETEKVCFNGGLVALGRHTSVAKFVSDSVDSSSLTGAAMATASDSGISASGSKLTLLSCASDSVASGSSEPGVDIILNP